MVPGNGGVMNACENQGSLTYGQCPLSPAHKFACFFQSKDEDCKVLKNCGNMP